MTSVPEVAAVLAGFVLAHVYGIRGDDRLPKAKTDKLAHALAAGQLWRAKEILTGRIGSGRYQPDLCEQLGLLLLRMGDDLLVIVGIGLAIAVVTVYLY